MVKTADWREQHNVRIFHTKCLRRMNQIEQRLYIVNYMVRSTLPKILYIIEYLLLTCNKIAMKDNN